MADLAQPPVLTITGSSTPGELAVKVDYIVTFDAFDRASNQPYRTVVTLVGDDTSPGEDGTDDVIGPIAFGLVQAGDPPQFAQSVSHTITLSNALLNEDQPPVPNPDEIRATVTLTPRAPSVVGPRRSNLVSLAL